MSGDNPASNDSASARSRASSHRRLHLSRKTRNSQTSSDTSERRSGNIFKTFFAQRNNDYRAATVISEPQYTYSQGMAARTTAVRRPSSGRSSPPPDPSELENSSSCGCRNCLAPSPGFLNVLSTIIESSIWRVIIVFNTILLLFGSEIQELWIPPAGDVAMDVLYCLALAVFAMDMFMRCYLEPKYVTVPRCRKKESAQNSAWGRCQLGSFLFWCDLVSTMTLLYNISFIYPPGSAIETIDIKLNVIGIPVSF